MHPYSWRTVLANLLSVLAFWSAGWAAAQVTPLNFDPNAYTAPGTGMPVGPVWGLALDLDGTAVNA